MNMWCTLVYICVHIYVIKSMNICVFPQSALEGIGMNACGCGIPLSCKNLSELFPTYTVAQISSRLL